MNSYNRIFGAGPRGTLLSLALLALAWRLEPLLHLPGIVPGSHFRWGFFVLCACAAAALVAWSVVSLPPGERGNTLVTRGPFRYLRHPLYAAFLSCFNFGLAVLLNNGIYLLWALLLHPLWHWNIRSEEQLMHRQFPHDYAAYCATTGRFMPRIGRRKK